MRPARVKKSLASASTLVASSISDMRVKLRSSTCMIADGRRSVCMALVEQSEQGDDEYQQRPRGKESEGGVGDRRQVRVPRNGLYVVLVVGFLLHLADILPLKFLKKSSATFFAAASTRRDPICASLPPTLAFTS